MFCVWMKGFQNSRQCLKKKGGQKTILLIKLLLHINEKKPLCQRGCGYPSSDKQLGNNWLQLVCFVTSLFCSLLLWFLVLNRIQNMYATVANLKSFVRGLPLVLLILFMQFQRQAYRYNRSGIHILINILFELVAFYVNNDRTSCLEPPPMRGFFRNEERQWVCQI